MKTLEGKLVAGNEGKDMRIGIVASRFNEFIIRHAHRYRCVKI